jgi:16S rRNA (cytosine1402-N4)-methyltransferase
MHQNQNQQHIPVLLEEVLTYLDPKKGESYLDLTAGYGGHAQAVIGRTLAPEHATLVDRDKQAIESLQAQFGETSVEIIHRDFLTASRELEAVGKKFDMILADIGVSSLHLNTASRGFSIALDGPLDMRMDQRQSLTAYEVVNNYKEDELAALIYSYGEDRRAKAIARAIVVARPVATTHALANIVASAARRTKGSKIHPATRTFQALRIAVNSELEQLEASLSIWIRMLKMGGRLVVISFHSLEDRLVKQVLMSHGGNRYDADLKLLTRHPITGSTTEIVFNPRARSAKLRAAVKIKNI